MANSIILKELIGELGMSVRAFETKIKVGGSAIAKAIGGSAGQSTNVIASEKGRCQEKEVAIFGKGNGADR